MAKSVVLAGVLGVMAIVAAACGGDSDSTVEVSPSADLAAAFDESAEGDRYTMTQLVAQEIHSQVLGDVMTELDPDRPTSVVEVTPELVHTTMDVATLFGTAAGEGDDPLGFEMWATDELMVIDSRAYQAILDESPSIELGPFEPGIASVDVEALGADSPDIAAALLGSAPTLARLADQLPAHIVDLVESEDQPGTFTGRITYADLLAAYGSDVTVVARSVAAGVSVALAVDSESLADVYVEFYESIEADVSVVVIDGQVREVTSTVDLSNAFAFVLDSDAFGIRGAEADQVRGLFDDTTWTIETHLIFEPDPDLVAEAPPTATEDRTEEWRQFLIRAGLVD